MIGVGGALIVVVVGLAMGTRDSCVVGNPGKGVPRNCVLAGLPRASRIPNSARSRRVSRVCGAMMDVWLWTMRVNRG